METGIPGLDAIGQQLVNLERPQKTKMLVVDDEPDNLDLLYRTFRREFNVLRADSGVAALETLAAEGEVAVIISDQRMPEMKGTEFLSKTVPQFPDTMRIILTGFTDVEDLVEAINSGQVYKYITKPWDPNELRAVVQRAVETYEIQKKRTDELRWAQAQTRLLDTFVNVTRQPHNLETVLSETAIALGTTFEADACVTQRIQHQALVDRVGIWEADGTTAKPLEDVDAAQDAIASQAPKLALGDGKPPAVNLLTPALFQNKPLALVSLQWNAPHALKDEELTLLYLSIQQVALAITCLENASTEA